MRLSINKQKEKDWNKIIKQEAIAKGWKFKGWFAYKPVNGFFYAASFYTSAFDNSISGSLEFKPLVIDDTFWEIVGLTDNRAKPLSFRGNGAFVVNSKDVYDYKLKVVPETLKADICELLDTIGSKVYEISTTIREINSFIEFVEKNPSKRSEWFDSDLLIVSSINQKDYNKALSLLDYAKKTRGMCSWGFGEKDFYDLAIEYSQAQQGMKNYR
jgi:hypothetical protein